jgi:hypothetical protein
MSNTASVDFSTSFEYSLSFSQRACFASGGMLPVGSRVSNIWFENIGLEAK